MAPGNAAWDLASLGPHTPVYVRIGDRWPDLTDHVLVYFADCVDWRTNMVLVWDLTTGEQFEAPIDTTKERGRLRFTRRPTAREEAAALDDVYQRLGHQRVRGVRGIRRRG